MYALIRRLWDLLLPETCAGCGTRGAHLCRSCAETLPAPEERLDGIAAAVAYRHPAVRRTLWEFKYSGRAGIRDAYAPLLYERIIGLLYEEAGAVGHVPLVLTEIPMSRKRLRERGRNHGLLLAEAVAAYAAENGAPWRHRSLLEKTRETARQAKAPSKEARLENIRSSMAVRKGTPLPDGWIVVIDDVATTGATLREAERALRTAGARHVLLVALAH